MPIVDMCKIILACDLDNTLIHSYKHYADGDICIEHLNGSEQGFMHPRTYKGIQKLSRNVLLVPVTSRSIEQYGRVCWPDNKTPHNALTTNGCILLTDNNMNHSWSAQSTQLVKPFLSDFINLQNMLTKEYGIDRCRMVDNMYLFARFTTEAQAQRAVDHIRQITNMEILSMQRKLYVIAPGTSKGSAVNRLKALLNPDLLICAGDCEADISMLQMADIAIVPDKALAERLSSVKTIICKEDIYFSDYILDIVGNLGGQ